MEFINDVIGVITAPGWRHFVGALLCAIGGVSTVIAAAGVLRRIKRLRCSSLVGAPKTQLAVVTH